MEDRADTVWRGAIAAPGRLSSIRRLTVENKLGDHRAMTGLIESSAIRLQPAFDDPVEVRSFVEEAGPFETLALAA